MSTQLNRPSAGSMSPAPSGGAIATIAGRQLLVALRLLLALTVVLGIAYPAVVLGVARLVAPAAANGSPVTGPDGRTVGSSLIGQRFDGAGWSPAGRPPPATATTRCPRVGPTCPPTAPNCWPWSSSGGPTSPPRTASTPPRCRAEAMTASASGLNPDISPEYALLQVNRVAAARGLPVGQVRDLVESHTQGRILGFIGQERVNVLELNLALLELSATTGVAGSGG